MATQSHSNVVGKIDGLTEAQSAAQQKAKDLKKEIGKAPCDHKVELTFNTDGTALITLRLVGMDMFAAEHLEDDLSLLGIRNGEWEVATWMCRGEFASHEQPQIVTQKMFV